MFKNVLKPGIVSGLRPQVMTSNTRGLMASFIRRQSNVVTKKTSAQEEYELLVSQRKVRPVSPHLTIYQPQLTWYLSSVHRVSGVFLGLAFYAVTIAFGVSTVFGLGMTTENLVQFYNEKIPSWMDLTAKAGFAYLFAFHFGNGIRHLIWDAGKELTLKGVYRTGYTVLALTAIMGSYLLTW
ncbi:Sdh3/Shh3 [Kluyveromyces lactis]|nr:Sdh3/Shh3 [Kluyveromyces lactis]